MKPIDSKKLLEAAKNGNVDPKSVMRAAYTKSILGAIQRNVGTKPDFEIDDREPMDRVADELARFTDAVRELNQAQAATLAEALSMLMTAVQSVAKASGNAVPVQVDIADSRPRAWEVTVTGRDRAGHIETVQVSAKHREKMN